MIREGLLSDRQAIYDLHSSRVNLGVYDKMEIYFSRYFNADNIVVNEVNGHVVASSQINYHTLIFNGYRLGAGVITANICDRNRHSYLDDLLKDIDDELQHKMLISLAITDEPETFRKLGFEAVYNRRRYSLTRDMMANRSYEGIDRSFTIAEIAATYKKFMHNFNGYYERSYEYWADKFETFKYLKYNTVVFRNRENQVEGYMVYQINQSNVYVDELVYLNGMALVRLLCYAFRYKEKITVMVSEHEDLKVIVPKATYRLETSVMAKVNNLPLFNTLFSTEAKSTLEALRSGDKPLALNEDS